MSIQSPLHIRRVRPTTAIAVLVLMLLNAASWGRVTPVRAQTEAVTVTYKAGYNLIAVPAGTDLSAVSGPLLYYSAASGSYDEVAQQDIVGNRGYWAFFPAETTVTLAKGFGDDPPTSGSIVATFSDDFGEKPGPGQWAMIGNPSGRHPAMVYDADVVYTYDPAAGFTQARRLLPGQGAWAMSVSGSGNGKGIFAAPVNAGVQRWGDGFLDFVVVADTPSPSPTNLKTFGSSLGFQFQAPGGWEQVGLKPNAAFEGYPVALQLRSPDRRQYLLVTTTSLSGNTNPSLETVCTRIVDRWRQNGGDATLVRPEQPMGVTGADRAIRCGIDYTDSAGFLYHDEDIEAVRGQTAYLFVFDFSEAFASENAIIVDQMLHSFQLTAAR